MQPSLTSSAPAERYRVYAELTVKDGMRSLKPCEVAFDRLIFRDPPHLISNQVEIILVNGTEQQRQTADVLPHDPEATRIPIRLVRPGHDATA